MPMISSLFRTHNFGCVCLRQIDTNTDGLVDFSEFIAATLPVHQLQEHDNEKWQQLSQAAFEKFDVDRDGFITPEELRLVSVFGCYLWVHCCQWYYECIVVNDIMSALLPLPILCSSSCTLASFLTIYLSMLPSRPIQHIYLYAVLTLNLLLTAYGLEGVGGTASRGGWHWQRWENKPGRVPKAFEICKHECEDCAQPS